MDAEHGFHARLDTVLQLHLQSQRRAARLDVPATASSRNSFRSLTRLPALPNVNSRTIDRKARLFRVVGLPLRWSLSAFGARRCRRRKGA